MFFQLLAALSSWLPQTLVPSELITAGVCLVRHGDSQLVVQDVWSRRYSHPGGMRLEGETPAEAARREFFEETGLVTDLNKNAPALFRYKKAAFFDCSLSGQPKLHYFSKSLSGEVLLLAPTQARSEIQLLALLPLDHADNFRFPTPQKDLSKTMGLLKSQDIELEPVSSLPRSAFLSWQITVAENLQAFVGLRPVVWVFNQLGEQVLYFILVAFLLCANRFFWGEQILLLTVTMGFLNPLFKALFKTPRPFELSEHLFTTFSSGFGFPSGHTQLSAAFLAAVFLLCAGDCLQDDGRSLLRHFLWRHLEQVLRAFT